MKNIPTGFHSPLKFASVTKYAKLTGFSVLKNCSSFKKNYSSVTQEIALCDGKTSKYTLLGSGNLRNIVNNS